MADSPDGIRAWPTTPDALADVHRCPGCFTPVSATVCSVCGFALTDPRAIQVLRLGRSILRAELERQSLISEVRASAAATALAAAAAALPLSMPTSVPVTVSRPGPDLEPGIVSQPAPPPEPVSQPAPLPAAEEAAMPLAPIGVPVPPPLAPSQRGPAAPAPAPQREPRPPRRRLSVPVLLLIVGVSLVGIAAIFFMVYAWFTWGIAVRALIIGAITIATIAIASLLRRRTLTATAEAISVLGVVLLALDAWAVRANDFFGTASVEPALYAGVSILAIGVLCRAWAKLSRLRSPDIAAVLALPIGLGLVVAGVVSLPTGEAIVAGLLAAALGGLAHALPAPWSSARAREDAVPERITLVVIGIAALVAAAIVAAPVSLDSIAVPLWSGAAVIGLGAAHALLLRPRPGLEPLPAATALAATASGTSAAVATLLGWQLALRADLPVYTLLVAPVIAVAVPVVLDRVHARVPGLSAARITAAVLGAVSIVVAVGWWVALAVVAVAFDWVPWRTDAVTALPGQADGAWYAAVAGLLVAALLFLSPSLDTTARRNVRLIAAGVILLSGAAVVAVPALLVGVAAVVAATAAFLLARPTLRPGAGAAAILGALTAFGASTATPWLWLIGLAVAVAVPIAAQIIVRPAGAAAAWLSVAPIGLLTVSAFLAPAALGVAVGQAPESAVAFVFLQWIALACLLCAVVLPGPAASRSTLAVSGYALFAMSLAPYAQAAFRMMDALRPGPPRRPRCSWPSRDSRSSGRWALLALVTVIALGRSRVAPVPALGAAVLVAPVAATATFTVLQTTGLEQHEARALATVGAAVVVVWIAATWSMLRTPQTTAARPGTRALVDLGALVTTLVLAWGVPADLRGAMLAVIAAGFAGASVSRGWAAPASERTAGVPSTRIAGVPTAGAPRRLLAWPAFAFATAALWSALSTRADAAALPIEAYVIAPAVGLLAFAVLLVWLRRHGESAVALSASVLLGLAVPAVDGWSGSPVRGTVVAAVAAALALALTWTPALRARVPALAGATAAVFALALVAVDRAVDAPPAGSAWLLLLVAVAYASALGTTRRGSTDGRSAWYAWVVPPLALAAAVCGGLVDAERPIVLVVALVVLGALHLVAAFVGRAPLGSATRWTALAGAVAFAVVGFVGGATTIDGVRVVELASIPVALVVLAGSAFAQWRLHREGGDAIGVERVVWLVGLALAVAPSVIAPIETLRVWLTILLALGAALIAVLAPIPAARSLRISSAVVLTVGALAMGARTLAQAAFEGADLAVTAAGAGAILVAAAMVWSAASRPDEPAAPHIPTVVGGAGAALLIAMTVVESDGEVARTTLTATIAAVAAVGGAALLGLPRWRGLGSVLAIAGLLGALVAIGARLIILQRADSASIEPDFWAMIALGITAAISVMALRSTAGSSIARIVAMTVGAAISAALLFFTAAELVFLGSTGDDELRTLFTMSVLTLVGVAGWLWRSTLGLTPPIVAASAAAVFGLVALTLHDVTPLELVTAPPALGLVALGVRALLRNPQARTWPTLGPGLALLTVPSLVYDLGDNELWRVVALGVAALALVVVGAVWKLQAPLVLGSVVLLLHGGAQLWPWISTAYEYVPWWLWLGIGGALLIFLAARYESNMRALRTSFTAVTSLR